MKRGVKNDFYKDDSIESYLYSKDGVQYARNVYKCGEVQAHAVFKLGSEAQVERLENFDIIPMSLPVLYKMSQKPSIISVTLDKHSLYPKYNMEFA